MMTVPTEVFLSLCGKIYNSQYASSSSRRTTTGVDSLASAGSCFESTSTTQRVQSLAEIITSCAAPSSKDKKSFRSNCQSVYSYYTNVSKLNELIGPSLFSDLEGAQEGVDLLLGGDGLCVAQVMEHLSQVFRDAAIPAVNEFNSLETDDEDFWGLRKLFLQAPEPEVDISSAGIAVRGVKSFEADFSIQELKVDGLNIKFNRFVSDKEVLIETLSKKNSLRFHQAIYKMESAYRRALLRSDTNRRLAAPFHQYIPDSVLSRKGLKLGGRIPEGRPGGSPASFKFEEIIPSLNTYATSDKVFMLGVSSKSFGGQHAIALSLKEPIHFLDPMYGFGFAETRNDLFLFLTNFLALKYGHNMTFSLLEFNSRSPVAA